MMGANERTWRRHLIDCFCLEDLLLEAGEQSYVMVDFLRQTTF